MSDEKRVFVMKLQVELVAEVTHGNRVRFRDMNLIPGSDAQPVLGRIMELQDIGPMKGVQTQPVDFLQKAVAFVTPPNGWVDELGQVVGAYIAHQAEGEAS